MAGQWRWRDELDAARCLRDRRQREAGSARAARSDPGSWWSRCDVERLDVARGGVRLSWRCRAALLQLCLAKDADAVKGKGKKEWKKKKKKKGEEEEEEEEERRGWRWHWWCYAVVEGVGKIWVRKVRHTLEIEEEENSRWSGSNRFDLIRFGPNL
ncbi:hypothetical protein JCGZ_02491 [Jatropha curcas]|uniref:Uncharacterized protein n=1 Tax=Jatropha curcas TaxID=180498 RepID=A0A067JSZ8_JATCU|nr:hypothetical protein JCGZ_02491 [Jatropha curcas]